MKTAKNAAIVLNAIDCEEKSDDIPAFGTEDPATDAEAINADDLMAEMQAAIER